MLIKLYLKKKTQCTCIMSGCENGIELLKINENNDDKSEVLKKSDQV